MNKPQLFCYTYAGGSASFYDDIGNELRDVDVIKFEYAGHGTRHKEAFYQNFGELAKDAFHTLREKWTKGPYALFGYSMGCITIVELLQIIIQNNMMLPDYVFLAAHNPLTMTELQGLPIVEMDDWVKKRTIAFGAVPEKLINNNAFWRTYLPIYSADYKIISMHRFEDVTLKTNVPATVFYSETDTPLMKMQLWENFFVGKTDYYRFEGSHFFMKQYHQEIARIIDSKLR